MPFLNEQTPGGGAWLRTVREDRRARPRARRPTRRARARASRPRRTRARRRARAGTRRAGARSCRRGARRASPSRDGRREAKPREPHAEQRAAPLGQQRLDGFRPLVGQRLGHLRGGVARGGERRAKLGVRRLGAGRRRDAVGVLAREVQCVAEPVERDLGAHVVEPVGRGGVAVEARERVRELRPELAHLLGVPLRRRRVRRHSWRLEHCRSLVASRPRNAGADAHCARRRGRRGASHARAREPRARGLRRGGGGDARRGRGGTRAVSGRTSSSWTSTSTAARRSASWRACGPRACRSRSSPARWTSTSTATPRDAVLSKPFQPQALVAVARRLARVEA